MTTHARQQIREAAATVVTSLATTGTRVHQSRMRPAADAGLPCLLVMTTDESIDPATVYTQQQRTLTLLIRGLAKATANLDDTLDTIALEVETAMAAQPTLGSRAAGMFLDNTRIEFDDETDKPVGIVTLEYRITYFTNAGSPGTIV